MTKQNGTVLCTIFECKFKNMYVNSLSEIQANNVTNTDNHNSR